jgi:translation initiation factor 1
LYEFVKMKKRSQTVYSTESGRVCPSCGQPVDSCTCREQKPNASGNGIVRIRREVKGRGGKTVTTITGVPLDDNGLQELAAELKRRCGVGGAAKDGIIVIQGDKREIIIPLLQAKGYTVKSAGG